MLKFCAALSLVALAGCHRTRVSEIQFTLTPSDGNVTVACARSSTGDCYFAFTGSSINLKEGGKATVLLVAPGSSYCADSHPVHLESCKPDVVGWKQGTVTKRTSSDDPAQ